MLFPNPLRYAWIVPGHPLHQLLDEQSRRLNGRNWLIFEGNPFDKSTITVAHFGPVGKKNNDKTQDQYSNVQKILNDAQLRYGLSEANFKTLSPSQIATNIKKFTEFARGNFLALRMKLVDEIESLRRQLGDHAKTVLSPAGVNTINITKALFCERLLNYAFNKNCRILVCRFYFLRY